jgi:hypothetical protein
MNKFQRFLARFLIPEGYYCHQFNNSKIVCPFWFKDKTRSEQESGYCSFLGKGDWDINDETPQLVEVERRQKDGTYKKMMVDKSEILPHSLLWNKCKECNVNYREKQGGK